MRPLVLSLLIIAILATACAGSEESLKADAGGDFTVQIGERPRFDGCDSTGEIVNYKWTILSAPDEMQEDAGKVIREISSECAFTLDAEMVVDEVGVWEIQLEISGPDGNQAVDTLLVTVAE
jgi:hypothetical protein